MRMLTGFGNIVRQLGTFDMLYVLIKEDELRGMIDEIIGIYDDFGEADAEKIRLNRSDDMFSYEVHEHDLIKTEKKYYDDSIAHPVTNDTYRLFLDNSVYMFSSSGFLPSIEFLQETGIKFMFKPSAYDGELRIDAPYRAYTSIDEYKADLVNFRYLYSISIINNIVRVRGC